MNAKNPNIRMKPPSDIKGIECPEMYLLLSSLNLSILGPRTIEPTKRV